MARDPNLKPLTVYVEKAVYKRVGAAAAADGRSVSNYLAQLLERSHPPEGVVHRIEAARHK